MDYKFSLGNFKCKVSNMSLLPVIDCPNCTKCQDVCYARHSIKQYPNTFKAWQHNSFLIREGKFAELKKDVSVFCHYHNSRYFRFHVGGDIVSVKHFETLKEIALLNPKTKFLAFTKSFCFIDADLPDNLAIICSLMKGMTIPESLDKLPRAYAGFPADFPNDNRAEKAIKCSGKCDRCYKCWFVGKLNFDVIFKIKRVWNKQEKRQNGCF
jgi:ferredoxin